jgi:uncharacterized RDD family membrane protein YckC
MLAFGIDLFFVSALFGLVAYLGTSMIELFTGDVIHPTRGAGIGWTIAYFSWFGLYLWGSIEIAGRTPGKALVGLRVTGLEGAPIGPGRALVRTLVFPFSFILGLGFIPAVTRKDRRALHELVAGCKEIVDWGDRQAGIPSALEGWVERQRNAQVAALQAAAAPEQVEVIDVQLELVPKGEAADTTDAVDAAPGARDGADAGEPAAAMATATVLTEPVSPDALTGPEPEADDDPESDYWAG